MSPRRHRGVDPVRAPAASDPLELVLPLLVLEVRAGRCALPAALHVIEGALLLDALTRSGGDVPRAAAQLGVPRRTAYRLVDAHDLGSLLGAMRKGGAREQRDVRKCTTR